MIKKDRLNSTEEQGPLWKKIAWMVALWCGSVLTITLFAYLIRIVMGAVGMTAS